MNETIKVEYKIVEEIIVDTCVDGHGFIHLKMPPNFAGREIKGKLLYQVDSVSLQNLERKNVDINFVRIISQHIRNLPTFDSRSPDEIIGYNEYGVPE